VNEKLAGVIIAPTAPAWIGELVTGRTVDIIGDKTGQLVRADKARIAAEQPLIQIDLQTPSAKLTKRLPPILSGNICSPKFRNF